MAKEPNLEKILSEFKKGDAKQQVKLFSQVKDHVTKVLLEKSKELEEESSEVQSTIERINGK